ncbi:methyltransferase, TIGR04325 family [Paraburkholderia silvatlantica]|uniref:Methyltransferase (TIGR04325 family) n=1 Tax=Paraburkholderia silvatlantica TaxID=321895 RepID=A0ABR6FYC7_9BURK|nr:methyltransferase, TIGR04325 family [Paraburkholderia silvatlantica]MBB2932435.1 putative methyltransferase (TIGR04325 family) [Paraburkholderia silvatlantica]
MNTLRDIQIVTTARIFRAFGKSGYGRRLIEGAGSTRVGAAALGMVLGYRRSFRTLGEAERAVKPYGKGGHESTENVDLHISFSARLSDYAAFYYLRDRVLRIQKVFDLGGNVGNLFYCYRNYIPLRDDVSWTVYDLPETIARGEALANSRNIKNLKFTDNFQQIDGADLFIASGSLHYFDRSVPELLAPVSRLPKYILINRTPLTDGQDFAIVQDGGHIRVACMLYNRAKLIADFRRLGYQVMGEWQSPDFRVPVLDRPSSSVGAFTGLWLELQ